MFIGEGEMAHRLYNLILHLLITIIVMIVTRAIVHIVDIVHL